jgi:hypothetical protein
MTKKTQKNPILPKDKGGRPSALTPEVEEIFKKGIELGLSYKDCCEKAGISFTTFLKWRKEKTRFDNLVRTANITMKENCLKSIQVGMIKDWKSAAWKLERRFPDEYKERKEVEITEQKLVVNDLIKTEDAKPADSKQEPEKDSLKRSNKANAETDKVFESA